MMSVLRFTIMLMWTLFLMILSPIFILFTFSRQSPLVVAREIFAPFFLKLSGSTLKIIGQENVPLNEPVIFVANHNSHSDIVCLCASLPVNLHFIGKKELALIPIVGWYMYLTGHIFIDRSNRRKSVMSIKAAALKIKEGKSVVMYPEGTRSKTGKLGEFKKGAFHLALEAGVKIIPVNISGTYKLWPSGSYIITPSAIKVAIGKPINSNNYNKKTITNFAKITREQVEQLSTLN